MSKESKQASRQIATVELWTGVILRGELIEDTKYVVGVSVNGIPHFIDAEDIALMIVDDPISSAFALEREFKITWLDEEDMTYSCAEMGDRAELMADGEYFIGTIVELNPDEIHLQIDDGNVISFEYEEIEGIRVVHEVD